MAWRCISITGNGIFSASETGDEEHSTVMTSSARHLHMFLFAGKLIKSKALLQLAVTINAEYNQK